MSISSTILRLFRTAKPVKTTASVKSVEPVEAAEPAKNDPWPMWRQGDVFIRRIEAIPERVRRSRLPHGILAHGELTGHSHRLEEPQSAVLFQGATTIGEFYLDVPDSGARIVHEEHGPIDLPTGLYRVWRQREYHPRGTRVVGD